MNGHVELIEKFIASFEFVAKPRLFRRSRWRCRKASCDTREGLWPQTAKLPARFPPLYEELILSHRWADVEFQDFTLLANPPSEGLTALLQRMASDKGLWETLIPNGEKGPRGCRGPVRRT
jgi:hypothetical protein